MKVIFNLVLIILILSIPVVIISSTVNAFTGSLELYRYGFQKYKISERTGISEEQLSQVGRKLNDYLNGRNDSPQLVVSNGKKSFDLYNDIEITHLRDVRSIIQFFKILQIISIAALLLTGIVVYLFYKESAAHKILNAIQIGSLLALGATVALVCWALIDFNGLFYLFHIISFSNDLWILDPSKDYLIMMFPEGFFNDAALFMIITIIIMSLVIWVMSFSLNRAAALKKLS